MLRGLMHRSYLKLISFLLLDCLYSGAQDINSLRMSIDMIDLKMKCWLPKASRGLVGPRKINLYRFIDLY